MSEHAQILTPAQEAALDLHLLFVRRRAKDILAAFELTWYEEALHTAFFALREHPRQRVLVKRHLLYKTLEVLFGDLAQRGEGWLDFVGCVRLGGDRVERLRWQTFLRVFRDPRDFDDPERSVERVHRAYALIWSPACPATPS